MNPEKWLKKFLEERGLTKPDGRMLYGYRLSDGEYQSLRDALSFAVQFGRLDEVAQRVQGFSQLFVLYASEWWRREYAGGAWRWDPIIESFNGDPDDLLANTRTYCVIRGFSYWNHRPSGAGKKYFGAVVAHGGLPLKAIGKRSGLFAAILSHTLRLAARYRWDEAQMADVVAERSTEFPASLRRVEIYELIARMVASVLELKREYALEGDPDPIATLNRKDPDWRQRFPLSLDDESAQALLAGLVREASQQVAVANTEIFVIERQLAALEDGRFELFSSMRSPSMVDTDVLTALLHRKSLPRYFSIDIQLQDRQPLIDARQVLGAESATISFASKKRIWKGQNACHDHSLQIRDVSGDLLDSALAIPGGEELHLDDPWVFASRDGKNQYVTSGSARIPEDEMLLVLPAGWCADACTTESLIESVGQCQIGDNLIDVYRASGEFTLQKDEQHYTVKSKQATGDHGFYVWEGRRLGFPTVPQRVFIGPPALFHYNNDGDRTKVSARNLAWFVACTHIPVENINLAQGPVDVFLMEGDERLARYRFVVLNSSARIAFESGATASEGEIVFSGWGCDDVAVLTPSVECQIEKALAGQTLSLRAGDIPPESINVTMHWSGCTQELQLRLPYPSVGGRFYDHEGRLMDSGEALPMSKLLGGRLRIFDRNPQASGRYTLAMNLLSRQQSESVADRLAIDKKIPVRQEGISEVRLIDLQRDIEILMGYSDDVDAMVEITLNVGGHPRTSIRVTRYEFSLERTPGGLSFSSTDLAHMKNETLESVVLMAAPLAFIDIDPIEITQERSQDEPVGFWQLDTLELNKSPWLIYPSERSEVYFRPTIWGGVVEDNTDSVIQSETVDLQKAITIPGAHFRNLVMESALLEMESDFQHPSWDLVEYLWTTFHHLPLSSVDAWRVIARNPEVAVALLLRSQLADEELSEFTCRFRDELGVVWELISLDVWRSSVDLLWQYWEKLLGKDDAKTSFPIILKARLEQMSIDIPSLRLMFEMILYEKTKHIGDEFLMLAKAMSKNPAVRSNRLWSGTDALVQTLLFRVHNPEFEKWPEPRLLDEAIQELAEKSDSNLQNRIMQSSKTLFWKIASSDFKRSVANIPVLCAIWSITGTDDSWWYKPEKRMSLRKVRNFDPIWFELAFKESLKLCLLLRFAVPIMDSEVSRSD